MTEERFFGRLRAGLEKTRQSLKQSLESVFSRQLVDADTLEELEEVLIMADLGMPATQKVLQEVEALVKQKAIEADGEGLRDGVVTTVRNMLLESMPPAPDDEETQPQPWVLMLVGVNGVGKTTTLGKLAHQMRAEGDTPFNQVHPSSLSPDFRLLDRRRPEGVCRRD